MSANMLWTYTMTGRWWHVPASEESGPLVTLAACAKATWKPAQIPCQHNHEGSCLGSMYQALNQGGAGRITLSDRVGAEIVLSWRDLPDARYRLQALLNAIPQVIYELAVESETRIYADDGIDELEKFLRTKGTGE